MNVKEFFDGIAQLIIVGIHVRLWAVGTMVFILGIWAVRKKKGISFPVNSALHVAAGSLLSYAGLLTFAVLVLSRESGCKGIPDETQVLVGMFASICCFGLGGSEIAHGLK